MQRLRWIFIAISLVSLFLLVRTLPVDRGLEAIESFVQSAGWWGPVLFVLLYALSTILMIPGSPLTIGAGAIFGLAVGTITVSLGSTLGAALTFLVGRRLARDRVEKVARRYPKFDAVDRAIGDGGWKIVALLRLSPALPFNVQNYLYGLTAVRFWPCVLASWVAMLPGTFMYVYFGYIARQGAEAAAGATSGSPGRWILTGVGLLATVFATVYITRRAKAAMDEQLESKDEETVKEEKTMEAQAAAAPAPQFGTTILLGLLAIALLGAAACAQFYPNWIGKLFGPPAVELKEAYAPAENGAAFDHSTLDGLVAKHVDERGFVDYAELEKDSAELDAYIGRLAEAAFDELGRDEKLALLINAYNAFTLRLILDYWNGGELKSIKDIPSDKRWDDERWNVGGNIWSLNQIEHQEIRPKFAEPRIHFALVCAAYSCPPLRTEAYTGEKLEEQLEDQTVYAHTHDRWFEYDAETNTVRLTMLYHPTWYGGDFTQVEPTFLDYAARFSAGLRAALDAGDKPKIEWISYSWALNDQATPTSER